MPCPENLWKRVEILISILFSITSIGLLVTGANCYNNKIWITDAEICQNVYISGIILTFILGVCILFGLLCLMVDVCDKPVIVNPVRRRSGRLTAGPESV